MPVRLVVPIVLSLLTCAPGQAGELPRAFHGTFAALDAPEACRSRASDGRVSITIDHIGFFASSCAVGVVRPGRPGEVNATTRCREEGDPHIAPVDIRLRIRGDRLALSMEDGAETRYRRCRRFIPAR